MVQQLGATPVPYPELVGMPYECLTTEPIGASPLIVKAPYQGVNLAEIVQDPLVSINDPQAVYDLFVSFWQGVDQDEIRGIGWASDPEDYVRVSMQERAEDLLDGEFHPQAQNDIHSLAYEVEDLLAEIDEIYRYWAVQTFQAKDGGILTAGLQFYYEDILYRMTDAAKAEAGIWYAGRTGYRDQIRAAYDKAMRLLWCAEYGANQSAAYYENQAIYEQMGGDDLPQMELVPLPIPSRPLFPSDGPAFDEPEEGYPGEDEWPPDDQFPPPLFPDDPGPGPGAGVPKKKAKGGGIALLLGLGLVAFVATR